MISIGSSLTSSYPSGASTSLRIYTRCLYKDHPFLSWSEFTCTIPSSSVVNVIGWLTCSFVSGSIYSNGIFSPSPFVHHSWNTAPFNGSVSSLTSTLYMLNPVALAVPAPPDDISKFCSTESPTPFPVISASFLILFFPVTFPVICVLYLISTFVESGMIHLSIPESS